MTDLQIKDNYDNQKIIIILLTKNMVNRQNVIYIEDFICKLRF